jgi:hypothetical protein
LFAGLNCSGAFNVPWSQANVNKILAWQTKFCPVYFEPMVKPTHLRDKARDLLLNRPVSLKIETIAEKTGLSISWLNTFARGEIANPGIQTVENLLEFFAARAKKVGAK